MADGVSNREFARILGLGSDNSVRKARKDGRLRPPAILGDGTIDPVEGRRQWVESTNGNLQRNTPSSVDASAKAEQSSPNPPPQKRTESEEDYDAVVGEDGEIEEVCRDYVSEEAASLAEYNRLIAREKLERSRVENAAFKGMLVDRMATAMLVETLARQFRGATDQFADKFAPIIAAELEISDEHRVYVALDRAMKSHQKATVEKVSVERLIERVKTLTVKTK